MMTFVKVGGLLVNIDAIQFIGGVDDDEKSVRIYFGQDDDNPLHVDRLDFLEILDCINKPITVEMAREIKVEPEWKILTPPMPQQKTTGTNDAIDWMEAERQLKGE